jgi:hypothetical protein
LAAANTWTGANTFSNLNVGVGGTPRISLPGGSIFGLSGLQLYNSLNTSKVFLWDRQLMLEAGSTMLLINDDGVSVTNGLGNPWVWLYHSVP